MLSTGEFPMYNSLFLHGYITEFTTLHTLSVFHLQLHRGTLV